MPEHSEQNNLRRDKTLEQQSKSKQEQGKLSSENKMMPKQITSDREHHISESTERDVDNYEEESKIEGIITKKVNQVENDAVKEDDLIVDQI